MSSKSLLNYIRCCFKISSHFNCIPYEYNASEDYLKLKTKIWKNIFFIIQVVTLHIYFLHYVYQLVVGRDELTEHLSDLSLLVFYTICWVDFMTYKRNFWGKSEDIVWLYNQTAEKNKIYGPPRSHTTMVEQVIKSWLPSQSNCIAGTMFLFLHGPTKNQFIYHYVPKSMHNSMGLFGLCFSMELMNIFSGATSAIVEFYMHTFFIRSFIQWTHENLCLMNKAKISRNLRISFEEMEDKMNDHQQTSIMIKQFTSCFGTNIELMKSSFALCSVVLNYVLIRWYSAFNVFTIIPVATCCFIVQTNPPLMYSHAYLIHDNSLRTLECLKLSVNQIRSGDGTWVVRGYLLKKIKSLRPLRITVAKMYFLDRKMVPLFLHIVLGYTLSLLMSDKM